MLHTRSSEIPSVGGGSTVSSDAKKPNKIALKL